MCGYYRRFVEGFARIAAPLLRLTDVQVAWTWGEKESEALEKLKFALTNAPVLAMPDFKKVFYLQTDACDIGISAILSQKDAEGHSHPIAYASRKLNDAETRYHTIEKEALALVWGTDVFRPYLLGSPFIAQTDNNTVKWLMSNEKPGRLSRWSLRLAEHDFTCEHIKGVTNPADMPSRNPARSASSNTSVLAPRGYDIAAVEMNDKPVVEPETSSIFGLKSWIKAQNADPIMKAMKHYVNHGLFPEEEDKSNEPVTKKSRKGRNVNVQKTRLYTLVEEHLVNVYR